MPADSYLSAQLRESAPYLADAGWRQTAALLLAAAAEIDELRCRVASVSVGPTGAAATPDHARHPRVLRFGAARAPLE